MQQQPQHQQVSFQLQDFHQPIPHIHHQHLHPQLHHPQMILHPNQHQIKASQPQTLDRSQHEATTTFMLVNRNEYKQKNIKTLNHIWPK